LQGFFRRFREKERGTFFEKDLTKLAMGDMMALAI